MEININTTEEFKKKSAAYGIGATIMAPFEIIGAIILMAFVLLLIGLIFGIILLAMVLLVAFSPIIAIGYCIGWGAG